MTDHLDEIRILGLTATGHHGVFDHERRDGQTFRADVVLSIDTAAAGRSDDLAATVSYADVAEEVHAILAGEPVDLLETLAARIADTVLAHAGVRAVDVTVHKPQAPLTVPFDDVQVALRRTAPAGRPPASPPARDPGVARPDAAPDLGAAPPGPVPVVLALGANLGDATATLRSAVAALRAADGLEVTAVSPVARTAPVLAPGQDPQPDYVNAVVLARTTLAPAGVLELAHAVEDAHGRVRTERWGARTLDVDVVAVGDLLSDDPALTLPHPRAHERAFVLLPWLAADPAAVLPGPHGGPVARLAAAAPDRAGLTWEPTGEGR